MVSVLRLQIERVTLGGRFVRLEPLSLDHVAALAPLAVEEDIWRFLPEPFHDESDVRRWVQTALAAEAAGSALPWVTIEQSTGKPIGSTRLMNIESKHRGVEIGSTWLGTPWWRTETNSEAKYLQLRHCFETLGCLRVCLKTDGLNLRSQRAIERLGARREGVLRKHMIVYGGRVRDTVYFSILDDEWPAIRARLEEALYGADLREA